MSAPSQPSGVTRRASDRARMGVTTVMGLFDWIGGKKGESQRREALAKERAGDLEAAVDLYLEAGSPDEAARVLLLRADAETSAPRRIAFSGAAARTAADPELKKRALARKASIGFDVLKAQGGSLLKSEVLGIARELEEAGELEKAADAFALAGDAEAEVRVLTAAGAIERLEDRLRVSETEARSMRTKSEILGKITDLDRTAERRAALEMAARYLAENDDPRVAHLARAIRARLARGPVVDLTIDGATRRYALGQEVTVGRGDATIVIASRAVSRRHVRIFRGEAGPMVEDLGTRNGTTLAGARLTGPIPIGGGVRLTLGTGVPCSLTPEAAPGVGSRGDAEPSPIVIEVAGDLIVAPLGELRVGPFEVGLEEAGELMFVALRAAAGGTRPALGGYELAPLVELCVGDVIAEGRGGPIRLRVPGSSAGGEGDSGSSGGLSDLPGRRV